MKKISLFQICFLFLIMLGCNKNEDLLNQTGSVQFTVDNTTINKLKSTSSNAFVLVSIKDKSGNLIYSLQENELYEFEGNYISKPFSLSPGEYMLSEFFVLDGNKQIIYASPISGSEMAEFVDEPLEIGFTVTKDETNKLSPEVVTVENKIPEDFGYVSFGYEIVETFDFLLSVFTYDSTTNNFELADAALSVISMQGDIIFSDTLEAKTNQVTIKDDFSEYIIKIEKAGYHDYQDTIKIDTLKTYFENPLITVLLKESTSKKLVLQPGPDEAKDAHILSMRPDEKRGDFYYFEGIAWTWNGQGESQGHARSLVEFDLSPLSQNVNIQEAKLYLFHSDINSPMSEHSTLSGSNECLIKRITSPWQEMEVTWNNRPTTTDVNQVFVNKSDSIDQNYIIDVTQLVKDMIDLPEESHGFMMQLANETPYRRLTFASSDSDNPQLHPKLEISYSY